MRSPTDNTYHFRYVYIEETALFSSVSNICTGIAGDYLLFDILHVSRFSGVYKVKIEKLRRMLPIFGVSHIHVIFFFPQKKKLTIKIGKCILHSNEQTDKQSNKNPLIIGTASSSPIPYQIVFIRIQFNSNENINTIATV